ncbi:hypothetical protein EDC01DRAFT_681306 [Geopyxis carbonaria]|nr:hypothetical protein EDC01DRAFT_681306 [Geopyxis carbonaria]
MCLISARTEEDERIPTREVRVVREPSTREVYRSTSPARSYVSSRRGSVASHRSHHGGSHHGGSHQGVNHHKGSHYAGSHHAGSHHAGSHHGGSHHGGSHHGGSHHGGSHYAGSHHGGSMTALPAPAVRHVYPPSPRGSYVSTHSHRTSQPVVVLPATSSSKRSYY